MLTLLPPFGLSPLRAQPVHLPSSKQLLQAAPGSPQRTNSLPITMAVSPDGRYVALLNAGYGSAASGYAQSIGVLDLKTNQLADFPEPRLKQRAHQTYFGGLAFTPDGRELLAGIASLTDPRGESPNDTGNAIAVYWFRDGKLGPERLIPLEPVKLGPGRKSPKGLFKKLAANEAAPYPAGIALVTSGNETRILAAANLADAAILTSMSGKESRTFDLGTQNLVPSAFPVNVAASRDGRRAWFSLWNASEVVELDLTLGTIVHRTLVMPPSSSTGSSSHPTALLLSPDEKTLYVAVANRDVIAVLDTGSGRVARLLNARMAGQRYGGAMPVALALSHDARRLYVADAGLDAVAVFDATTPRLDPLGFIPTEWYPTALAVVQDELIVASGKGVSTTGNANVLPPPETAPAGSAAPRGQMAPAPLHPYILDLIYGSVARIPLGSIDSALPGFTRAVAENNLLRGQAGQFPFASGRNPIRHVLYIIKENRTYDQVFGDIKEANGDPSLVMYGESITPNQHKLARQFGVLDNFYDSGEVSGDGHVWSTAAITSDYLERWYPVNYRGGERTYDGEGFNSSGIPLLEGIPDLDDPGTGYLWENALLHGITFRNYGEYTAAQWCTTVRDEGFVPPPDPGRCPVKAIAQGEPLPANVGQPHGSPSPYPWTMPALGGVIPMKLALRGHTDLNFFPWSLDVPDQLRADEFLNEFEKFTTGGQEFPSLMIMRLGNDHTAGTRAGHAKPAAQVADNDLAVGRMVEAISHSRYWDDTAILIVEDDAQNGADHVDAHRSTALVISKYSPASPAPFVDHAFYTTVNMVHTIEALIGLPPMNLNDAYAALMAPLFSGPGTQAPFTADYSNRDNGLLYQVNAAQAPGARTSARLDFSHADAAPPETLNRILWRDAKGNQPMPKPRHAVIPAAAEDDR
ncbi:MAG: phosphoesterase [Acidobacteria bacterium]|nr:phosphoesterase [Acidobacteriota bacterium]